MKNNRTKKYHKKFTDRNVHKRKSKDRAKQALLKAVAETGVGFDALKIGSTRGHSKGSRAADLTSRTDTVARGIFSSSKSGFGFVTLNDSDERDIFIPQDRVGGAIDGDLVEISYHMFTSRFGERKSEGRVKKIVQYGRKTLIGTVSEDGFGFRARKRAPRREILIPDDQKIQLRPMIRDLSGAKVGDKVEVLLDRKSPNPLECTVIRNFGDTDSKEANYEAILAECEIDVDFTPDELAEADFFASMPLSDEGRVRRDRDIIFTIDGEGAKDLDDAVSLRKLKDGWRLGVHIADVSHYVRERTKLDRAVMARGTSVYFTDKVVPMLPPSLSNGACSLNAGEEKYTLSAIIDITSSGDIRAVKIEPSIIKSRVRGVYSEVNKIFDGSADGGLIKKYKPVIPTLLKMRELYLILKEKSSARGALDLDTAEAEILLDDSGTPCDIIKRERGDAEKLIEQFMLCANEAVATLLYERQMPCVYRVHERPPEDKLSEFLSFAHNLGFDTSYISRERSEPKDFRALLEAARERGISTPVSYTLLRSMSKARYSDEKQPHFGLGIDSYCHFTSPIRRLSDLATHRIIHKVLLEGSRPEQYRRYAARAAAAATEGELRALSAERRIENLYKVIYMSRFVGCEFDATISSVTSFGFFAELENTCEGLVPISELWGMFAFDEKNLTLVSRDKIYRLGEAVRVRLEEADMIRGKLRFSVAD